MNRTSSHSQITLHARGVRTLRWNNEHLIDWVSGTRFSLDGAGQRFADPADPAFDGAVDCGPYAVIFERLGTRAKLLHDGRLLRELSRDDYCAEAYEYPACLWRTRGGRTLLAHCPEHYNHVEIDDAETGARLTSSTQRKPADFFHSRLQVDPSGRRLLSAGWVWHPWDVVGWVELAPALEAPCTLDNFGCDVQGKECIAEESSACWQNDHRIIVGASEEGHGDQEIATLLGPRLRPNGIAVYDVRERRVISEVGLGYPSGTMMPVGQDAVLTLHEHPRLVSLVDGQVLHEWRDLPTGVQTSSIIWGIERPPPMALDPDRRRFAVVREDEIVVVRIGAP